LFLPSHPWFVGWIGMIALSRIIAVKKSFLIRR